MLACCGAPALTVVIGNCGSYCKDMGVRVCLVRRYATNRTWFGYTVSSVGLSIHIYVTTILRNGQVAVACMFQLALSRLDGAVGNSKNLHRITKVNLVIGKFMLMKLYSPHSWSLYFASIAFIVDLYLLAQLPIQCLLLVMFIWSYAAVP